MHGCLRKRLKTIALFPLKSLPTSVRIDSAPDPLWIRLENAGNFFRADPVLRLRFAMISVRKSLPTLIGTGSHPLAKGDSLIGCRAAEFSLFRLAEKC